MNQNIEDYCYGLAVGSPLGPSLANIVMCALEHKFLDNCPSGFKPALYCRYVDDTFAFFVIGSKLISSCLILIPVMKISLLQLN